MKPKFLVIGSNSFSGSHFINHLILNDIDVVGVSRSEPPHNIFLPYKWNKTYSKKFNFFQIDLNKDLKELECIIKKYQIDYVVNFASQGMVAESWKSPEDWYITNVLSQVKLHDKLRKLENLKKYIHISTPEVYGSTKDWIKENFNFEPNSPYAVSRAACDLHLKSFHKAYDFPVIYTRAANVYGPGQQLYRIIPRTILATMTSNKLDLHGGGTSARSFINIQDVVNATFKIAINGIIGDSYHISTNESISIKKLVLFICNLMGKNFDDVVNISDDRLGKDEFYLLDSSKIRKELKWSEKESFKDSIVETIKWIENNFDTIKELPITYEHKK